MMSFYEEQEINNYTNNSPNTYCKACSHSNQSLAKTKALLRQHVWFPNINKAAKEEIDTRLPCQVNGIF